MTIITFNELSEYNTTIPTGVYEGKMWKRHLHNGEYLLCWFDVSNDPTKCSIQTRKIIIS